MKKKHLEKRYFRKNKRRNYSKDESLRSAFRWVIAKADSPKIEEEILIRVQFKANLETQYLLNCICKKRKTSRDRFMAEMIHQEAKKENIVISINL
jgi:hypothetical protein